jgi:hypothetical protein
MRKHRTTVLRLTAITIGEAVRRAQMSLSNMQRLYWYPRTPYNPGSVAPSLCSGFGNESTIAIAHTPSPAR